MGRKTALYDRHRTAGAKLMDFAGWDMPLHYGSQLDEHARVREGCGVFDVSHMGVIDVRGAGAIDFLRFLLANDVQRLSAGKALYSCLLNEEGGILDDLIVYRRADASYRLIVNAGRYHDDLDWLERHAKSFDVDCAPLSDYAILAIQGPEAARVVTTALPGGEQLADLAPFTAADNEAAFVGRTGYTGEDGFEAIVPAGRAGELWDALLNAGCRPCGLGARDSLRLEAGLNLYGEDMGPDTTPLETNLGWTVAWNPPERDFIGRAALEAQRARGVTHKLVGLVLDARGVLRGGQSVYVGTGEGEVTSGTFSPVLGTSIALARVPVDAGHAGEVDVRGRRLPVRLIEPPFVRKGRILVSTKKDAS